MEQHRKVIADHLGRDAYLYVRQSTLRQVIENTESTKRQYALRQRAVALGWDLERVVVVDCDQGQSGASSADREGFKRLVAEVSMGKAGIVLGLEVSRLARNNADWHRLLEICALTRTLICDEDGLYDPCEFNDRLLLGLKGTMSEAELHVLQSRLRGGILSKAQRGKLISPLPIGLCYDSNDNAVLDPDVHVQEAITHFFATFRRTGSARATVKAFSDEGLLFPKRLRSGPKKGDLVWAPLYHFRALQLLHNPRYAGAFCFGRRGYRKLPDGRVTCVMVPKEQWHALIKDAHPGYITWPEFEDNQSRLHESAQSHGTDRRASPPREGPALLQGLVVCGVCGARMTVRYHTRHGEQHPDYVCYGEAIRSAARRCQSVPGTGVDEAVGELLLTTVTPVSLEVALQVQQELESRIDEADRLRAKHVERARYEAELARRRYMAVDPDNRLVADALEAEWNERLRALGAAHDDYERQRASDRACLSQEQRERIAALATDFPALWRDPKTEQRDRKRMMRLLIEDVTLLKRDGIVAHVRFKGGQATSLSLPIPPGAPQLRKTAPTVIAEIDRLLDHHTDAEVAAILNERGFKSGEGKAFHRLMINNLRHTYGLKSRHDRLRAVGMLTLQEIAEALDICTKTVKEWRDDGLLRAHSYNDKRECLYEHPGANAPKKFKWRKRSGKVVTNEKEEVQCEA